MNKRLKQPENNIADLQKMKARFTVNDIKAERTKEWALRYGLLESIQIVIDLACHLVVHNNLGNAETYADCIRLLADFDYIDQELKQNLTGMTGLRNILVHEYVVVDIDRLYNLLNNLDDYKQFVNTVNEYI